jgi:LacI family transcriptional regulator
MPASLFDVAQAVGVSISTVSRALNHPNMVDEKTRQRIQSAVKMMGYVPQGAGRALVSRETFTIGAIISQIGASAFAKTIEALRTQLSKAGYTLLLAQPTEGNISSIGPLRVLIERGVDSVVLLGGGGKYLDDWKYLLEKNNIPLVNIWADTSEGNSGDIGFDNYLAGQTAVNYLLSLGHLKFALISGALEGNQRASRRYLGILETIASNGGQLMRNNIKEADYTFQAGYDATLELLNSRPDFTALICGNDYLALGAISALRERGLEVPKSISVIGFNNSDFSPFINPPLTTVSFPSAEIGMHAAELLVNLSRGEITIPKSLTLPTQLIIRESCKELKQI